MKYILLAGAMMLPLPALAWTTAPTKPTVASGPASGPVTSSSGATSASRSGSRSELSSSVTVNNSANAGGGASTGGSGGGGGGSGNGGRAPDVLAPSISGGNPCSVGATAGGSGMGGGGLLGLMWESHDCALRQQAALFANLGRPDVAIEILCHDAWVRDAMAKSGTPCAIDRERWLAMGWKP